jgi:hypothetical protein
MSCLTEISVNKAFENGKIYKKGIPEVESYTKAKGFPNLYFIDFPPNAGSRLVINNQIVSCWFERSD